MIFVDTSFWVALRNRRDTHHEHAVQLLKTYGTLNLMTSTLFRGETWTFLRRRLDHHKAVGFLDLLDQSQLVRVEPVTQAMDREALTWLRRHDERKYSHVDSTSFAFMRSYRIREALAFDGDFAAAGFTELRSGET